MSLENCLSNKNFRVQDHRDERTLKIWPNKQENNAENKGTQNLVLWKDNIDKIHKLLPTLIKKIMKRRHKLPIPG